MQAARWKGRWRRRRRFSLGLLISGPRINLNSYALRARALLARPWSARCYGVARHREGSRQNSIGVSGVLSLRHFGLVLLIRWRVGGEGIWRGEIRKTRRLLTNRPCSSLVYEESDSKERLRVSSWIVQRLYNYAVKKTVEL